MSIAGGMKVAGAIALPVVGGAAAGMWLGNMQRDSIAARSKDWDAKAAVMTPGEQVLFAGQRKRPTGSGAALPGVVGAIATFGGMVAMGPASRMGYGDARLAVAALTMLGGLSMLGAAAVTQLRHS